MSTAQVKKDILVNTIWIIYGIAVIITHFQPNAEVCVLNEDNFYGLPVNLTDYYVIFAIALEMSYFPFTVYTRIQLDKFNKQVEELYGDSEKKRSRSFSHTMLSLGDHDSAEPDASSTLSRFRLMDVIGHIRKGSVSADMHYSLNSGMLWSLQVYIISTRLIWGFIGCLVLICVDGQCQNNLYLLFLYTSSVIFVATLNVQVLRLGVKLAEHPYFATKIIKRVREMDSKLGHVPVLEIFLQAVLLEQNDSIKDLQVDRTHIGIL